MQIGGDVWSALGVIGAAFGAGAGVGWLLHRHRERVSHEERARARLSDLRYDAFLQCMRAVSEMTYFKGAAFDPNAIKMTLDLYSDDGFKDRVRAAHVALTSNLLFLPKHLRDQFWRMLSMVENAKSLDELSAAGRTFAAEIETYLPRLQRRALDRDERPDPVPPGTSSSSSTSSGTSSPEASGGMPRGPARPSRPAGPGHAE